MLTPRDGIDVRKVFVCEARRPDNDVGAFPERRQNVLLRRAWCRVFHEHIARVSERVCRRGEYGRDEARIIQCIAKLTARVTARHGGDESHVWCISNSS